MECMIWGFTRFENLIEHNRNYSRQSLAGRWVLKKLLEHQHLPHRITFHPQWGYPQVGKHYCSIAHTAEGAVAALSPFPIGIDIELKNRLVRKVVARIVNEPERVDLQEQDWDLKRHLDDPEILFWVGKEALSKALGLGLQVGFQNLKIKFQQEPRATAQWSSKLPPPFTLEKPQLQFMIHEDFLVALCSEEKAFLKPPRHVEIPCPDFSKLQEWEPLG